MFWFYSGMLFTRIWWPTYDKVHSFKEHGILISLKTMAILNNTSVDFFFYVSWCIIENGHSFELNEDPVFFKWMDFIICWSPYSRVKPKQLLVQPSHMKTIHNLKCILQLNLETLTRNYNLAKLMKKYTIECMILVAKSSNVINVIS